MLLQMVSCYRIAGLLILSGLMSGCAPWSAQRHGTANGNLASPRENLVQLRYATLPSVLRVMAVHYWFAVYDAEKMAWTRWEVWQNPHQVPTSWGHVHQNLMRVDSGVGGGPCQVAKEWRGQDAQAIIAVLNKPEAYPHQKTYRAWPGPNSNTYAAWVLAQARVPMDLQPMAIGKDYRGLVGGGVSPTRTGVQGETPLVGLTLGLKDGVELHLLCLTFGLDFDHPALKTPFGRLGVTE